MTKISRGLKGVVLTETRLSGVDGEAGELLIAGYRLEDLAAHASHEEVLFLLWHDRLPTASELGSLHRKLASSRHLPQATIQVLREAATAQLEPMDALRMAVDTLSLADGGKPEHDRESGIERAIGLVARVPAIVAAYWRLLQDEEPVQPRADLPQAAAFLHLLTGEEPELETARGLETYLNAVIDHGMNASTFTARVITATRSDMVSAIVGAIGALKGPLHGGAPGPALDNVFMLSQQSQNSGRPLAEVTEEWARKVVGGGERIMGFGHRVYRVRDPRAEVLGQAAARLFERSGDALLFSDAQTVERVVQEVLAELKPGRRLQTNVEFYTALLLHGVGLQPAIFSSVFAMGRVGGWTAHVLEQREDDILIRPRSRFRGERNRAWTELADRV